MHSINAGLHAPTGQVVGGGRAHPENVLASSSDDESSADTPSSDSLSIFACSAGSLLVVLTILRLPLALDTDAAGDEWKLALLSSMTELYSELLSCAELDISSSAGCCTTWGTGVKICTDCCDFRAGEAG